MIVARVAAPNTPDRFFKIEPGTCTIGANLECDVVLLDGPVLPHHLTLHAGDAAVEVEVPEGAYARFEHFGRKRTTDLAGGSRIKWYAGDRLVIQDIILDLEGVAPEDTGKDSAGARKANRRGLALCGAAAFLILVPAGVGSGLVNDANTRGTPSITAAVRALEAPASPAAPAPSEVRRRLEALGARPDGIARQNGGWNATFYVADAASRHDLAERLSALDFPLVPTIYVDEQLKEAAAITLANLSDGAAITAGAEGRLTVARAAPDKQIAIRQALLRDVPGIIGVDFPAGERGDPDAILANVTGLWHGRYPYVVLADHTVVRPGQQLSTGAILLAVTADHLLVKIGDMETRVYLP